jgi:P-type conjugative transfer protein TrbJ
MVRCRGFRSIGSAPDGAGPVRRRNSCLRSINVCPTAESASGGNRHRHQFGRATPIPHQKHYGWWRRFWKSNESLLDNLGGLISEQEGLSYTFEGLASQFQQLYPGYQVTTTPGAQSPQAYVDTTLNTLNGALTSAQAQAQNFGAEQTNLSGLELKNETAIGNLQAVQVGNEIALAQVQQVQLLRQLVMAEMNSQNTAAANQLNAQVQSNLAAQAVKSAPYPGDTFRSPGPPPPQP